MSVNPETKNPIEVSVIVPARNEADCVGDCLRSLVAESEPLFELGRDWEILLVDDHSTDATAQIAGDTQGVRVLSAGTLPEGWTGKANACWTGAQASQGDWLLFTDADTVHEQGSLRRALREAEKYEVEFLSYSPKQIAHGLLQRAVMPLVFAELARTFPPDKVSAPDSRIAAANGQFLLITRAAYNAIGGHRAVQDKVLEDVELARLAKRRNIGLRFRYAPDALAAHMYRTTRAMFEGWTKNLALLFNNTLAIAAIRMVEFALLIGLPLLALSLQPTLYRAAVGLVWLRVLWRFLSFVSGSNFPWAERFLAIAGLPLYCWLLYQSWFRRNVIGQVSWKGRAYSLGKNNG